MEIEPPDVLARIPFPLGSVVVAEDILVPQLRVLVAGFDCTVVFIPILKPRDLILVRRRIMRWRRFWWVDDDARHAHLGHVVGAAGIVSVGSVGILRRHLAVPALY